MLLKLKTKKLILPVLLGLVLGSFLIGGFALAQYGLDYGTLTGLGSADLRLTIMKIIRIALGFLGVVAIALLVYAGFVWMTAGGEAEKVEKAKRIITSTVIGLVIIMLSFAITSFIINQLAGATGAQEGQACEFGVDTPQACSTNLAGCPGQRICQSSNLWGSCVQTNSADPRCQPSETQCRIRSITPSGDNRGLGFPMNSVVRVRFNQGGITSVDANNFIVTELNSSGGAADPVDGTRDIGAGVMTFTPLANCPAPAESARCFKADTKYEVKVTAGSVQCGGRNLVCSSGNECLITFTVGDYVDTAAPTAMLIDRQVCQVSNNKLQALVNDDFGVAEAVFTNANNNTEIGVDSKITVPPAELATIVWDATAYPVNSVVAVNVQANDYDSNTVSDNRSYTVRAAHCCNNKKDADEPNTDCGGADCEECIPTIEWVTPADGAAGNLITIHGRHFDAYASASLVEFSDAGTPSQITVDAPLASTVNPACTNSWADTEVIVVVPAAAQDGPIKITRSDGLSDSTNDSRGFNVSFDVNATVRPGLCTVNPVSGKVSVPVTLQGVRFVDSASTVYFGAEKAGGTPVVANSTQITGVSVPNLPNDEVAVRVNVNNQYTNPKSFIVGLTPGNPDFICSSDPLVCSPDQTKCKPNQYCNDECKCEARLACDSDNFATASCEPSQGLCPGGWFCYDSTHYTPDSSKADCYCYQAGACDNPTLPADSQNLACHPDSTVCPTGYSCDPLSNCTCQPAGGIPSNSTYAYFFQSGVQPGPCSSDDGLCSPDDTLCGINEVCNLTTCYCELVSPTKNCDRDPGTPACEQNNLACAADEFCDTDCLCKPVSPLEIPCDDNVSTPTCEPNNEFCPEAYTCNSNTCLCVPAEGIPDNSTYTWFFNTVSFGPRVVENCNRTQSCNTGSVSSPTPYDREGTVLSGYRVGPQRQSDGAVPIDSIISAMFTTEMYRPSLTAATVKVYRCNSAAESFSGSTCSTPVGGEIDVYSCGETQDCFDFNFSDLLTKNYWYQIVLNAPNIFGANGSSLIGNRLGQAGLGDYSWAFKTRDSDQLSQVGCVYVQPPQQTSYIYNDQRNWTSQAAEQDFVCAVMDPDRCGWDWSTNETVDGFDPPRAEITEAQTNHAVSTAYAQTIPNPPVDIVAACNLPGQGVVNGQGSLVIDFSTPFVVDRFPDCGTACLNSLIGATFSLPMSDESVTNAMELYVCYDDPGCDLAKAETVSTFHKPVSPNPAEASNTFTGYTDCFDLNADGSFDYCLLPDTYYRMVITNAAVSREGRPLGGLNFDSSNDGVETNDSYSWVFKTQADYGLCIPDQIEVIPDQKFSPINKRIQYSARPKTAPDSCDPEFGQRLNPYSWNWGWDTDLTSNRHEPLCTGSATADFLSFDDAGSTNNYYCNGVGVRHLRDSCGNKVLEIGEDCDDGNTASGDGCSGIDSSQPCTNEGSDLSYNSVCGNGILEIGEDCDDGNTASGDGCSGTDASQNCLWEGNSGYVCRGTLVECDPENSAACFGLPADCIQLQICGNGILERTEDCDDGNTASGDGCSQNCLLTGTVTNQSVCGDGVVGIGEQCDLGDRSYRHCSGNYSTRCDGYYCSGGIRNNLTCSAGSSSVCSSGNCGFTDPLAGTFSCIGGTNAGADCTVANNAFCPGGACQSNTNICSTLNEGSCVATPQSGDGDNCSATCLIEDSAISMCRSAATNRFIFTRLPANGECAGSADCGPGESCVQLSTVTGNANRQGAVCGNRVIESGEECDFGGVCSDNGASCTTYNLSGCRNPETATCRPQAVAGCDKRCLNSGSVHEGIDPPTTGSYQLIQTLADGETYVQAWLTDHQPARGPLGEGYLAVGGGAGFRVIDWWPDCSTACLNSAIGGQFSLSPKLDTLPPSIESIHFYECTETSCPIATATELTRGADFDISYRTEDQDLTNDIFEIGLLPGYGHFVRGVPALRPNTAYRVVVSSAVQSIESEPLGGLNFDLNGDNQADAFSWVLNTQPSATLCQLDQVSVIPDKANLEEDGNRLSYFVQAWAYSNQCGDTRLNSYQYDWSWDDVNVDAVDAVDFVTTAGRLQDGCGNGRVEFGEDCDYNDPNLEDSSFCSRSCQWTGTLACPTSPLIPNSNFTSVTGTTVNDWQFELSGNGTLTSESVIVHPGSDSLAAKVTVTALAGWGAQIVSRTAALTQLPEGNYTLAAWLKSEIVESPVELMVSNRGTAWVDGTGRQWAPWESYHADSPCQFTPTSDNWVRVTCPVIIPPAGVAGPAPVQFQFRTYATGRFFVDDVNLTLTVSTNCCGNRLIGDKEQCEDSVNGTICSTTGQVCDPADPSSCPNNGVCYDYCDSQCLFTGNTNHGAVCGNGLVEAGEMCDLGIGGQNDDSDGCANFCRYAGSPSLPSVKSLCGDGQIGLGEECDGYRCDSNFNDLIEVDEKLSCNPADPAACGSNPGACISTCTNGQETYCNGYSDSLSCSNDSRCYWTGSPNTDQDCLPRPCIINDFGRNISVCKANATSTLRLAVDFNQTPGSCNVNYSKVNLSGLAGNTNFRQSVCGNRVVEAGEECDDGGQCQNSSGHWISCTTFDQSRCAADSPCLPREGYCPTEGSACTPGTTCATGICHSNFCVVGSVDSGSYCSTEGSICNVGCLSDGCGGSCTYNSSFAQDGRIDPSQVVQSLPLAITYPMVREEIYTWHTLQPDRAGRGDLTVYIKSEVPFAIIGHQPAHDPAAENLQCRNVAIWAVFSREVDLETLRTCRTSGEYCNSNADCESGDECTFSNISLQACSLGSAGSYNCPASLTQNNYVKSVEYERIQGQCVKNHCQFPNADFDNAPYLDSFCRVSSDCLAGQINVTSLAGHCAGSGLAAGRPCDSFRNCGSTSGTDLGFCSDNGALCTVNDKSKCTDSATAQCQYECLDYSLLAANSSYRLAFRQGDNGVRPLVGEDDDRTLKCNDSNLRCDWNFSTSDNFCDCNYLSVTVNPTSAGNDTVEDFFSCAGDNCGQNTAENPLDDDAADGIPATEANYSGNQHIYGARCWDISYSPRMPINDGVIRYSWLSPSDPDDIIFMTRPDNNALVLPEQNIKNVYITPGADKTGTPQVKGKNGTAYVNVAALEYKCAVSGSLCVPDPIGLDPRGSCTFGTGPCQLQSASDQQVEITNFICDNPWPDNPTYEDYVSNAVEPDTNFKFYYCQDDGKAGFSDDLPSLPIPDSVRTVRTGPAGTNVMKELIFPLCHDQAECDGLVSSNLSSGKGIGIQVLKNPLHLSPSTWYRSGLCGGVPNFANLCFTNDDCGTLSDANLVAYWGFDEAFGTVVADGTQNNNDGVINYPGASAPEWVNGHIFKSLRFDSAEDNVEIADRAESSLDIDGDLTIAAWVNFAAVNSAAGGFYVVDKDQAYSLAVKKSASGSATLEFSIWSEANSRSSVTSPAAGNLAENSWQHVVAVYDRQPDAGVSLARLYINGQLVGNTVGGTMTWSGGAPAKVNVNNNVLKIGSPVSSFNLNATIDEVRIYNRALSTEEVAGLAQAQGSTECKFNVPNNAAGSPESIMVDGYEAVKDQRTVYVGATNLAGGYLFSDIYLISHDQNADSETVEIFNRILDTEQQDGVWSFNTNFTNVRVCLAEGYFEGTTNVCNLTNINDNATPQFYSEACAQYVGNTGKAACDNDLVNGCYWSDQAGACLAKVCQPISCASNFDCPNLNCYANKEKLVRDAKRYGDLRDTQIAVENYNQAKGNYPDLAAGTYIAGTTFSAWPSWDQTLAKTLATTLSSDPINLFYQCPGGYLCDENGNGKIDAAETTSCNYIIDPANCPNQCIPRDPDQGLTCWDETSRLFVCPAVKFCDENNDNLIEIGETKTCTLDTDCSGVKCLPYKVQLYSYAYNAPAAEPNYQLFANFEYGGIGNWRTRPETIGGPLYQLPLTSVDPTTGEAGTCRPFNFEVHEATISGGTTPSECDGQGGDVDIDGVCELDDNCAAEICTRDLGLMPADCYNPDQRDSDNDDLGDVCDFSCTGDTDKDGICDEIDNCRTISNRDQFDHDNDGYGDVCDPCTDIDHDGSWDVNTGANVEVAPINCKRDNSPVGYCETGDSPDFGCWRSDQCSGGACKFDQSFLDNPIYDSITKRGFLASDHFGYCTDSDGNPLRDKPCCLTFNFSSELVASQYSSGTCGSRVPVCDSADCHGADFGLFSPYQEDFDGLNGLGDLVGYIVDDCIDFDGDNFGDYSFYTGSSNPATAFNLSPSQKEHFRGCAKNQSTFTEWGGKPVKNACGTGPTVVNADLDAGAGLAWQSVLAPGVTANYSSAVLNGTDKYAKLEITQNKDWGAMVISKPIVSNGNFESGTTAWLTEPAGNTVTTENETVRPGSEDAKSVKVNITALNADWGGQLTFKPAGDNQPKTLPGGEYVISAWVKQNSPSDSSDTAEPIKIIVASNTNRRWVDGDGNEWGGFAWYNSDAPCLTEEKNQNWQLVYCPITIPPKGHYVDDGSQTEAPIQIQFNTSIKLSFYVDDVLIERVFPEGNYQLAASLNAPGDNLNLFFPGFQVPMNDEALMADWRANWVIHGSDNGTREIVVANRPGSSGRQAAKVTIGSLANWGAQLASRTIVVNGVGRKQELPGGEYILSAWIKSEIFSQPIEIAVANRGIAGWEDNNGRKWGEYEYYSPGCTTSLAVSGWQKVSCLINIPPAKASEAPIQFQFRAFASGTFYVDDIQLQRVSSFIGIANPGPIDFIDGNGNQWPRGSYYNPICRQKVEVSTAGSLSTIDCVKDYNYPDCYGVVSNSWTDNNCLIAIPPAIGAAAGAPGQIRFASRYEETELDINNIGLIKTSDSNCCGNSIIESAVGEACDQGAENQSDCDPGSNSCSFCNLACHLQANYADGCTDSDGGNLNPANVAGMVVVYNNNERQNYSDTCIGDQILEYSCSGSSVSSSRQACLAGFHCRNGACVSLSCGNGICEVGEICRLDCYGEMSTINPAYNYCADGFDNDQDNCTDNHDAECGGKEGFCKDGLDNDCDGKVDCADTVDCSTDPACAEICNDGRDNDLDGYIDCQDFDCLGKINRIGQTCCGNRATAGNLDDSVCGNCELCSPDPDGRGITCQPQTADQGRSGGTCLSKCNQCVAGACVPYSDGSAGECSLNEVCQAGNCRIDPTPPTPVSIVSIGGVAIGDFGGTVSGLAEIVVDARDNVGVVSVEFFVDNVSIGLDDTNTFQINWVTSTYAPGPHVLKAVAKDGAGNQTASASVNVTVVRLNLVENCADGSDNDADGYVDCADIECAGQTGPDNYRCCWDGSYNSDNDSLSYCNTCERCRTPGDIGSSLTNDYQCRPAASEEGVGCMGQSCMICKVNASAGVCVNRAAADGLEAECPSCQSCADGTGGTCLSAHEDAQDSVAPNLCASPSVCQAGNCGSLTPVDTTAPAAISDLAISSVETNSAVLTWHAPGDDGTTGTASSYSVRYSTSVLTEANWNSATRFLTAVPTPAVAGTAQSATVSGLTADTTYYFGIKTSDEVPNQSTLSNIPNSKTLAVALYCDEDNDSHYNTVSSSSCPSGRQRSSAGTDCNDTNVHVYGGNTNAFCDCDASDGSSQGTTEICDGKDNNCDGTTDEGCGGQCVPPTTRSCSQSPLGYQGVCAANTADCTAGGYWETADCEVGKQANDATCNNVDNDCDGTKDEDYPSTPTSCGVGACARTGAMACVNGTVQNTCVAGTPAANDVTCDNVDDDCSGAVDEDYVARPTTCGVGACARTGTETCLGGSPSDSCVPGTPGTEVCDQIDNDCDGTVDEGCGGQCYVTSPSLRCSDSPLGYSGVCAANLADCVNGSWDRTDCAKGTGYQSIESSCTDDLDNDCDGLTDCQDSFNCPASAICSGNCVTASCNGSSHDWICGPDGSVNCGQCGVCALTSSNTYNCQANSSACETSAQGACYQCGTSGPPFTCQAQTSGEDTAGLYQCSVSQLSTVGNDICAVTPCKCSTSGICIPDSPDSDYDGTPDILDICPYDPNNDFDNDGLCAVGCTSGSSRNGTKTNGYVCAASSAVTRDTCQGSSCNQTNSCKAIVGAEDYFNVYINGKLIAGNLYLPHYQSYNLPASVVDNVNFNINDYLVSGENVISFEAFDTNPDSTGTPTPGTSSNDKELRGAFADYDDTGLCSLISTPNRTDYLPLSSPGNSNHWPTKCYAIINGSGDLPSSNWKNPGFTETAAWTDISWGNGYGAGLSDIDDRLWYNGNSTKYNSPRGTWHSTTAYETSYIFCRTVFTR